MGWDDRITVTTDPHARRGNAGDCAIARPLRQAYGGEWSVTQSGAVQTDGAGRRSAYRLSVGDRLRMAAFDAGLPMGRRRVTLTRRRRWHVLLLLPLTAMAWAVGWVLAAGLWWTLPVAAECVAGLAYMLVAWNRAGARELAVSRAAAARGTGTAVSRPPATARSPQRTAAAGDAAASVDWLPARGTPR